MPKKVTDNYIFVSALEKVIGNDLLDDNVKIFRKDYKTRTILKLIDKMDLNNNLKWIEYKIIKFYMRQIINETNEKMEDKDIDNLIKYITEENENLNLTEVNDAENNKNNDELNSENSINEKEIEQIDNSKEQISEDSEKEESDDINIINNNALNTFILFILNLKKIIFVF